MTADAATSVPEPVQPAEGKLFWNQESTEELISRYEAMPELWDVNVPSYRNRAKKQAAIRLLADRFGTTEEEINRKIHNLRNQMSQEVKKLRSYKCGESLETRYQGKWPYFNQLKFILPALYARSAAANLNASCKVEPKDDGYVMGELKPGFVPGDKLPVEVEIQQEGGWNRGELKGKLKRPVSDVGITTSPDVEIKQIKKSALLGPTEPDEFDIFGQYVASELRGIRSEHNKRKLKRIIQKSILEICEQEDLEYMAESQNGWFRPILSTDHTAMEQVDQHPQHQPNYG